MMSVWRSVFSGIFHANLSGPHIHDVHIATLLVSSFVTRTMFLACQNICNFTAFISTFFWLFLMHSISAHPYLYSFCRLFLLCCCSSTHPQCTENCVERMGIPFWFFKKKMSNFWIQLFKCKGLILSFVVYGFVFTWHVGWTKEEMRRCHVFLTS